MNVKLAEVLRTAKTLDRRCGVLQALDMRDLVVIMRAGERVTVFQC
jgi:hypothetical protein